MSELRPGGTITVDVEGVGNGGVCIARYDGKVVFLRHALPGEQVVAEVTQVNAKFVRADVTKVLTPSRHRVPEPCPYASACGGCDWQHATVDYQRELKAMVIAEQMQHLGGVHAVNGKPWHDFRVQSLHHADFRWRTRNRYQKTGDDTLGMFLARSKATVEIDDCLIAMPGAVEAARSALPLVAREVAVVSHADGTHTVVDSRGGPIIHEAVAGRTFHIHGASFWQVHRDAADTFVEHVLRMANLQPGETVADLFAGAGLFAAHLALAVGDVGTVVAVESGVDAVRDARRSLSDLPQVHLKTADVATWLASAGSFHVIVLDPPRAGAGLDAIADVARVAERAIVYVACEPSALGRDTGRLRELGWELAELVAIDAFPMTSHVECIALFYRA